MLVTSNPVEFCGSSYYELKHRPMADFDPQYNQNDLCRNINESIAEAEVILNGLVRFTKNKIKMNNLCFHVFSPLVKILM